MSVCSALKGTVLSLARAAAHSLGGEGGRESGLIYMYITSCCKDNTHRVRAIKALMQTDEVNNIWEVLLY